MLVLGRSSRHAGAGPLWRRAMPSRMPRYDEEERLDDEEERLDDEEERLDDEEERLDDEEERLDYEEESHAMLD